MKMLMEIDPLPLRGSMVMTMVMISPSRRDVSPAEQLCRSPRLVPPRFRLVAAESRPERLPSIFFLIERLHIGEDGHRRATRGAHEVGGRAQGGALPTLVSRVWAPLVFIFGEDFSLFIISCSVEFQDFWSCSE